MTRKLSPYEQTHLARFGMSGINIDDFGEMPVEYITGKVEFDNKVFQVNKNVLIPRIETEELINLSLKKFITDLPNHATRTTEHKPLIIADIGCGSGAIGICLAERLINARIKFRLYMSEISPQALEIAEKNIQNLLDVKKIEKTKNKKLFYLSNDNKIVTLTSDLLKNFPQKQTFDLMVANLPYIPSQRIEALNSSVKDYEPHLALDGGIDGLELISKFTNQAKNYLKKEGLIILEVDYTHDQDSISNKIPEYNVKNVFDQFSRQRFSILTIKD